MKLFDKKNSIKITNEDLKDAKLSSADFENENVKKRAFINVLGARLAMKFLFSHKIDVSNLCSLYTIHNVLEELDLADIYYQGIKIDVRLIFNENEIFIPKKHFEYDMLPDLYLVMTLKEDFSEAELLGFLEPKDINKENSNGDFYFAEPENIQKTEKLKNFLDYYIVERDFTISEEDLYTAESTFLGFVDKEISKNERLELIKRLSGSFELRQKFVEFENFEFYSKEIAKNETMLHDEVLDIVGAQLVSDEEDEIQTQNVEKASFEQLEEKKDNEENKAENKILESGLAVAAGLGLGAAGAAIAATSVNAATGASVTGLGAAAAGAAGIAGAAAGEVLKGSAESIASAIDSSSPNFNTEMDNTDIESDELEFIEPENIENEEFDLQEIETSDNIDLDELINSQEIENSDLPEFEDLITDIEEPEYLKNANLEAKDSEISFENSDIEDLFNEETDLNNNSEEPVFEFEEDITATSSESQEPVYEFEDELSENIDEVQKQEEILPEFTLEENADFSNTLEELPELEELEEINFSEEELSDEIQPIEENKKEDVYSIDDFDFNELKDEENINAQTEEEPSDGLISFEDLVKTENEEPPVEDEEIPYNQAEIEPETEQENEETPSTDTLSLFNKLEESEDESLDDSDELISQVDDFLKDIELSDEQKELLANEISLDDTQEAILQETITPNGSDVLFDETFDGPQYSTSMQDIDQNLLPKDEDDADLLKVLFEKETVGETDSLENMKNLEDLDNMDLTPRKASSSMLKDKKMVIAASVASVVLASLVIGGGILHNQNSANVANNLTTAPISTAGQTPGAIAPDGSSTGTDAMGSSSDPTATGSMQGVQPIPGEEQADLNRDMGKAVSDAFSNEPVNTSITKVAWEVPEDLAYNDSFRKYLQIAGKNLKLNLQNDLLLATEMAYSNKVIVDLEIGRDGSLQSSNVAVSSGSKQIDKIVLQSVKDTLKYLKMPSSELSGQSADATLIINF